MPSLSRPHLPLPLRLLWFVYRTQRRLTRIFPLPLLIVVAARLGADRVGLNRIDPRSTDLRALALADGLELTSEAEMRSRSDMRVNPCSQPATW